MEYPTFENYQLLDYQGSNRLILKLKTLWLNNLIRLSNNVDIKNIQINVRKRKPLYILCNKTDIGQIISQLKELNEKNKKNYFIKTFTHTSIDKGTYVPVYKDCVYTFDDEQNEFLIKNFGFNEMELPQDYSLNIGKENEKIINEQFGTSKTIKEIKVSHFIGETDTYFYLRYGSHYYKLIKTDEHPIKKMYLSYDADIDKLNKMCKWPEWVEKNYTYNPHQIEGIKFALHFKKVCIFDRAGVGKTHQAIGAAILSNEKKILVVTQKELKHQWKEMIEYFGQSVSDFQGDITDLDDDAKFHVIHYHQLDNDKSKEFKGKDKPKYDFLKYDYGFIIADEAHEIRNLVGVRGKRFAKISNKPSVNYVMALTASPFETNEHVYSLLSNLGIPANGIIPDKSMGYMASRKASDDFKIRYCTGVPMKKNDKVFITMYGDSNTYELAQRIKYSFLCRTDRDIEGFPELNVYNLDFKMGAVAESEYLKYKRELKEHYAKLKERNKEMNEDLPIFAKIREFLALQACEQTINVARNLVLSGQKVLIFTHFQSEYDKLRQYLAEEALWVHVTKQYRWKKQDNTEILNIFKTSPEKNILIGNIKTLGTGHNIPQADSVILNSPNWATGEHMQSMSRPRRLNRNEPVSVYFWNIPDTEIEHIYKVNDRKRMNSNILLGLPLDYF